MKVMIDADLCTGCEDCVNSCPDIFEMGDDDLAHVKQSVVPGALEDSVREAADACPAAAIEVE